jgi:predicted double-glycine peptidase
MFSMNRCQWVFTRPALGLGLALSCCLAGALQAGTEPTPTPPPNVSITLPAGLRVSKRVRTFKDLKDERAVRQKYDFSCGAAALTILLKHYYNLNVTEESVVNFIIHKRGPEEAIRRYKEKKGFSLLDLKVAAASVGFKAVAYSDMTLVDLVELKLPVIVPIRIRDYDHFIVFRGLQADRVVLTDPIIGNTTMKTGNFVSAWRNGVGMILASKKGMIPTNWQPNATQQSFVSEGMTRSLMRPAGPSFVPHRPGEF